MVDMIVNTDEEIKTLDIMKSFHKSILGNACKFIRIYACVVDIFVVNNKAIS